MNKKEIIITLILDTLSALIVWFCFYIYRRITNDFVLSYEATNMYVVPSYSLLWSCLAFPCVILLVNYLSGYYNSAQSRSRLRDFYTTLISTLVSSLTIYFFMIVDDNVADYRFYYRSFLILWFMLFFVAYVFRAMHTFVIYKELRNGKRVVNVLIVGTGDAANRASTNIRQYYRRTGCRVRAFVKVKDKIAVEDNIISIAEMSQAIVDMHIERAIIAVDDANNDEIFSVANRLIALGIDVLVAPRQFDILVGKVGMNQIDGEPYVHITRSVMPAWQQSVKRVFDIAASLICATVLSPLMIYVAIKIAARGGDVLFKQKRVGRGGCEFTIYKFRTMVPQAEETGPQLTSQNDQRITPFGAFLRKYRIDELPQLWNIFKGEMSFVGPRPERRFFIEQIEQKAPYYCLVYRVRPGLLSWGPIKIGYADSVDKMIERLNYDVVYVDNQSIANDIKIIAHSAGIIMRGEGR